MLAQIENVGNGYSTYRCECGTEKRILRKHVVSGRVVSCGCHKRRMSRITNRKHGHTVGYTPSRTYRSWTNMISRCENPNTPNYKEYGALGVTICARWRDSFEAFLADMGERPPRMSLDRIKNDLGYEPGNCRWATLKTQAQNRSTTIWVEHVGERLCLLDFAAKMEVNYRNLRERVVNRGEDAVVAAMSIRSNPTSRAGGANR